MAGLLKVVAEATLAHYGYARVPAAEPAAADTPAPASSPGALYAHWARGVSPALGLPPTKNHRQLLESYRSWVYSCLRAIAFRVAALPLDLVLNAREGDAADVVRTTLLDHPFLDLIWKPNPHTSRIELWLTTMNHLELTGNAYWLVLHDTLGIPREVWPLYPQFMRIVPHPTDMIAGYVYTVTTPAIAFELGRREYRIVHFKYPSPVSPYYGMGPLEAQAYAYDLDLYTEVYQRSFFQEGARPDFVFETDQKIDKATAELTLELWDERHKGPTRTWRPGILGSGMKAHALNVSNRDMAFAALADWSQDKILSAYGVPRAKLGLVADVNRCLDADSECLTSEGWVKNGAISETTQIACYNTDTRRIEHHVPLAIFRTHYQGEMLHWAGATVDVCVTHEHRLWMQSGSLRPLRSHRQARNSQHDGWRATSAEDLRHTRFRLLPAAVQDGTMLDPITIEGTGPQSLMAHMGARKIPADVWAEFLGYFLSEGCIYGMKNGPQPGQYRISLSQKKPHIVEQIRACLQKMPVAWGERTTSDTGAIQWQVRDRGLYAHLVKHVGAGTHRNRMPGYVRTWPSSLLRVLLEAAILGDGNPWKRSAEGACTTYYTASPGLADDIQEVAIRCGLRASISMSAQTPGGNRSDTIWRVNLSERKKVEVRPQHLTVESYDGTIWCVTVPTSYFVVRRNGRVHITGNSNADAADLTFNREAILPRVMLIEERIENDILPLYPGQSKTLWLDIDFENPVPADREAERADREQDLKYGVVVINEIREERGDEPVPWGDKPILPIAMAPLGSVPVTTPGTPTPAPAPAPTPAPLPPAEPTAEEVEALRTRLWEAHIARTLPEEEALIPDLTAAFTTQEAEVIARLEANWTALDAYFTGWSAKKIRAHLQRDPSLVDAVLFTVEGETPAWVPVVQPHIRAAVNEAGLHAIAEIGVGVWDLQDPAVLEWIAARGLSASRLILGTTRDALRATLVEGVTAGESMAKLIKRIKDVYGIATTSRARTIARTEINTASSWGTLQGYKQSGVVEMKEWLSARDGDRVRPTHRAADGQQVGLQENFQVGAGSGPAPGHIGLAEEDIGCRCGLLAVTSGGKAAPAPGRIARLLTHVGGLLAALADDDRVHGAVDRHTGR